MTLDTLAFCNMLYPSRFKRQDYICVRLR